LDNPIRNLLGNRGLPLKSAGRAESSGDLLPTSRQGQKNTASQDEARKPGTDDGGGD
jgi:hypothetical protein